jgi:hypothetical protein
VQPAQFGAAMQLREYLAGVEQAFGVKGAFQALLLVEIDLGEHDRHQIAFFNAHAMLAGQHTANFDAERENFRAEFLGLLQFARHIGIVENERMQIAVAGVKHVGDA